MADLSPGQVISLPDGRRAVVRFVGATHFAAGDWIGIELDEATGKNDGAVQGERYFDCEQGYGMFIRPSAVTAILEEPRRDEPKAGGKGGMNGAVARGRPPSGVLGGNIAAKRQSCVSTTVAKRQSSNASSPSPAPRMGPPARPLRSPTKSPSKSSSRQSISTSGPVPVRTMSSAAKAPVSGPKTRQSLSNRASMPPPPTNPTGTRPPRQSLLGSISKPSRLGAQGAPSSLVVPTKRFSLKPVVATVLSSEEIENAASDRSEEPLHHDPPHLTGPDPNKTLGQGRLMRPHISPISTSNTGLKEVEDLKTKLRVMEKKRLEDREKLKALDILRSERDKFEGIIQKLQAKYQPQQQEIGILRKQLKDAQMKIEQVERLQAEHDSIVEMAALDREMAEEVAEAIKTEYEALKMKAEELEMEVEVLREENQELGQVMSPEEKSTQGWLQMERTNERLREALIRLRDMTQQQEADLKSQIKELEEDLEEYGALKIKYETTREELLLSDANLENLKQQVEALGAEEMIEELAEKNMQYQEQINELKAVIEDLESLKELNDELEFNHVETEKQLQDEIDYRESMYQEQCRRVAQQDEAIEDLAYTLSRFRELVSNLQNDLEDMRISQQITETEASDLMLRSRAMADLNMKLQASVSKAQIKTIDVELGRMESEESVQHLSIMKLYLPEYFDTERNPILTLLRFKRVRFKAMIMNNTVRERVADPIYVSAGPEIFTAYDVLEKLTWITSLCDRFVNFMSGCSSEEFSAFGGALYELEPVERTLNFWIDCLRKNELNEKNCAVELKRSIALLSHLAETLIPSRLEAYAEELYMRSILIQTYLDHTASSLSHLRLTLQARLPPPGEGDEEGPYLFQKIDTLANQARGGKIVTGKVTRSLQELKSRSLALPEGDGALFKKTERTAKELTGLARVLGENVMQLMSEEGRIDPFSYAEISANMSQTVTSLFQTSAVDSDQSDALSFVGSRLRELAGYVEEIGSASSDLSQTIEFERYPSPWITRAQELKSNRVVSPDTDEELRRLKNEINEVSAAVGIKDKTLEEQSIKIELLESRMRDAGKKAGLLKELETKFEAVQVRERELVDVVEKQSRDLQSIEAERDDYRTRLEKVKRASGSSGSGAGTIGFVSSDSAASFLAARENESLRAQVASLQAAVRFLRDDNRRAHLLDPSSAQRLNHVRSWLDIPLVRSRISVDDDCDGRKRNVECRDVLTHLLKLSKDSKLVDLKGTVPPDGTNRLAWRPVKSTARYYTLRQREEFEQWSQWKDEVSRREREGVRKDPGRTWAPPSESAQSQLQRETLNVGIPDRTVSRGDDAKAPPTPRSMGVMDRAWRMLGMQRDEVSKAASQVGTPGEVRIVT